MTVDTAVQDRAYAAALRVLRRQPWVAGVYVWQWRADDAAVDPATDADHSPQNKPAERRWPAGSAAVASPEPPPSPSPPRRG